MENKITHTMSAGGVVLNQKGKVLVVSQNGNSWSLPKGHIEKDETSVEAAQRETLEESGVKNLELIKELGTYERYRIGRDASEDTSELKTITIYLFKTTDMDLKPTDPHNPEARWVNKEKVAGLLTHPKDKEFFESIKGKI
ncbi:MAG TPA: NUDIX domain-containing protein [Candidatus Paceibacterota bacterium]|nr:NUDIX domain-containing protein [Candidatus Paceibacterota bacterium]